MPTTQVASKVHSSGSSFNCSMSTRMEGKQRGVEEGRWKRCGEAGRSSNRWREAGRQTHWMCLMQMSWLIQYFWCQTCRKQRLLYPTNSSSLFRLSLSVSLKTNGIRVCRHWFGFCVCVAFIVLPHEGRVFRYPDFYSWYSFGNRYNFLQTFSTSVYSMFWTISETCHNIYCNQCHP